MSRTAPVEVETTLFLSDETALGTADAANPTLLFGNCGGFANDSCLSSFARKVLVVDPTIRFFDPFHTVVNEHEAARLIARPPDIDFVLTGNLRLDYLPADRRGSLLSTAIPGTPRPVHVMKTRHPCVQSKILSEVPTHALGEQFF